MVEAFYMRRGGDSRVLYLVDILTDEERAQQLSSWLAAEWGIVAQMKFPRPWPGVRRAVVYVGRRPAPVLRSGRR